VVAAWSRAVRHEPSIAVKSRQRTRDGMAERLRKSLGMTVSLAPRHSLEEDACLMKTGADPINSRRYAFRRGRVPSLFVTDQPATALDIGGEIGEQPALDALPSESGAPQPPGRAEGIIGSSASKW
jgi:hypothetical protein